MPAPVQSRYLSNRPLVLGLAKIIVLALAQTPLARAAPIYAFLASAKEDPEEGKSPEDPSLWLYLGVAALLVLLGGAFAGLTIALMGQVSPLDPYHICTLMV
jgi:metal transporter CNNM